MIHNAYLNSVNTEHMNTCTSMRNAIYNVHAETGKLLTCIMAYENE